VLSFHGIARFRTILADTARYLSESARFTREISRFARENVRKLGDFLRLGAVHLTCNF
jgi:hypothetical protein